MKRFLILAMVLAAALCVRADDYANIINRAEYTPELEKLAEEGDVIAQAQLGLVYKMGSGVERNMEKAIYWYTRAAEAGRANAMVNLGSCYLKGDGVDQDPVAAANWFRMAADGGNQAGLYNLAVLYLAGMGVEKNPTLAFEYAKKAADDSEKTTIYDDDMVTRQDRDNVSAKALVLVAVFYKKGIGTAKDDALAVKYMERAAAAGDPDACIAMAELYETGDGVKPDPKKAAEYRSRAEKLKAQGKKSRF